MQQPELIPHLFRTEYRKIVAVLCKHFGFIEMETAEDIASDTFMVAAQTWGLKGLFRPTRWPGYTPLQRTRQKISCNARLYLPAR